MKDEKEIFILTIEIATMQLAYYTTRLLGIGKYIALSLFIIFSLFEVPSMRTSMISFGWIMLTFLFTLIYKASFDKFHILKFLLIISAICSTGIFIVYLYKSVYDSKYGYLVTIYIGSWLLEKIISHVGCNYAINCKEDYIRRGFAKESEEDKEQ